MKKKTTQETKIHSNPLQRKNSKRNNRKILFQKKKEHPLIEIESYLPESETPEENTQEPPVQKNKEHLLAEIESHLTNLETPEENTQEPPVQQNKEHLLAEIESYLTEKEKPDRYHREVTFQKNEGRLIAKKPSKTRKITQILADNIIEIILLTIGILFLILPTLYNIKIGFTLLLIATFLLFLLNDTQQPTLDTQETDSTKPVYVEKNIVRESLREKIRSLPLPNTISLILILWTLLLFVLVNDLEIYIILLFIGILITREITDQYLSNVYKMKLNIYILFFLVTYIVLISQKIIEILQI